MSLNGGLPPALSTDEASPEWLNKADNAWQLTATTMVGLQSVPGLVILYGSMVKKKWAVNSSFMALYAFAAVLVCWVLWAHNMAFGDKLILIVGKPDVVLSETLLLRQTPPEFSNYKVPMADYVFFQFAFAAITVILLAGSLLGRMKFLAWMMFVPLWLTFCYTVGAFSIWGNGFGEKIIIDYAGGYVIHLSSGVAGFTAAYWVGPRSVDDRKNFPPNNIVHVLGGAGFLWLGWTGFNGGSPFSASTVASLAVCNTHLCTATSILMWMSLDMIVYKKVSVIGAVQGMITGLVCITPGAGLVDPAAAAVMGALSGSAPWYTMMILHRKLDFFQNVDDTLGVFHTHAVAGALGGLLTGCFARPNLLRLMYGSDKFGPGIVYAMFDGGFRKGLKQFGFQVTGLLFIAIWNVVGTSLICVLLRRVVSLRMDEDELKIGDDAVHGEEAYAVWGDGDGLSSSIRLRASRGASGSRDHY